MNGRKKKYRGRMRIGPARTVKSRRHGPEWRERTACYIYTPSLGG